MFGSRKKVADPPTDLRCSFCKKSQHQVQKLIAGPEVYICDKCIDVCVDILEHDRRTGTPARVRGSQPWPTSDAWCAFCGNVADLRTALVIENRTLLCEDCVRSIAAAAKEAQDNRSRE